MKLIERRKEMNRDNLIKNILDLTKIPGISSREEKVTAAIKELLKGRNYKVMTDRIGNLTFEHKGNKEGKKKVLVFAHVDELGIIVRGITENGFILFDRVGGVNTQILPGTKFVFDGEKGLVEGFVGVQAHHFMPVQNKFTVPQIVDMYIDVNCESRQEVLDRGIDIGTLGGFLWQSKVQNDKFLVGKTMDNRASVGLLIELLNDYENKDLDYNLYVCFPVQEEFNVRGIMPVMRKINPDLAIGFDITPACDTPDLNYNETRLNGGPSLCVFNFHAGGTLAGVLPYKPFNDRVIRKAKENNIPLQKDVAPGVITENAFAMFENEDGIRVGNLSVPCRYTHTFFEKVSISDLELTYKLLDKVLENDITEILND